MVLYTYCLKGGRFQASAGLGVGGQGLLAHFVVSMSSEVVQLPSTMNLNSYLGWAPKRARREAPAAILVARASAHRQEGEASRMSREKKRILKGAVGPLHDPEANSRTRPQYAGCSE